MQKKFEENREVGKKCNLLDNQLAVWYLENLSGFFLQNLETV